MQVFGILSYSDAVGYNSKVQEELQVLNVAGEMTEGLIEARDMTTNFFKNKAEKEVSEEDGDMGPNFHNNKTTDWFKIKAEKEVLKEA